MLIPPGILEDPLIAVVAFEVALHDPCSRYEMVLRFSRVLNAALKARVG